ncbi:3-oxosteroid 1-dehydrogenase [Phytohabitans suffuscus]|uniref:3-oxosteroid 1-dehydrogenase n=1 Tax=Phytohabitans suffuscus TaxID=624315 RepID=A0A6F8YEY6_9ACTN|nr:FAD-binding protein [Phytohabitans suffuscus]BCB84538.1 3-oxosteroid 1-dehydrogenase [Phytohabitans suffuscus]
MYYNGAFDRGADVIIIGYGDAGAVTAMTAHDDGSSVLIVEKQAEDRRRPNSRFSGGNFISPNSVDGAVRYMSELYRINDDLYEVDPAVIRTWAEETSHNVDWLRAQGGECLELAQGGEHRHIEGYESITVYKPNMYEHPNGTGNTGWGYGLFKFLTEKVIDRGIEVLYGAAARALLTNAEGDVIGVRVDVGGRELNLRAGKGVVMTCGGFEFNPWMKQNFLRVAPTHFYGNPENTGDGILMAQEVGAELWHMNSCAARLVAHFPQSGYPGGLPVDVWGLEAMAEIKISHEARSHEAKENDVALPVAQVYLPAGTLDVPGVIFTDRFGRRYTNELYRGHTLYYELTNFDSQKLVFPKVPSWWIFDERRRAARGLPPDVYGPAGPLQQIPWSDDNLEEIDKGWILSGDTIEELADKCGMEPAVLKATVDRYNAMCAAGVDDDFDRPPATLVPVDRGPYYAVQLWPGGPNTQGGPRRNAESQIMRADGRPIPGLYSAGEFGSVYGMLYPAGGGNIGECLAFGRLAGRMVAARRA